MNSNHTKAAAVAVGLVSTWATAHADDFIVRVTPNNGESLSDLQLFTARTDTATNGGTSTQSDQALTALSSPAGGTTLTVPVSTSYGTSVALGDSGTELTLGLLATSNGFAVLGSYASPISTNATDYNAMFGSTGVTQSQALNGILASDKAVATRLYPSGGTNALTTAQDSFAPSSGYLYRFDAEGRATSIGSWSAQPVPEPASLAALGLGAVGLLRRRRKLA